MLEENKYSVKNYFYYENNAIFAPLKENYMFAIVDIAGHQYKVEKEQIIHVHRLEGKEGDALEFDKVLLLDNEGKTKVGDPHVKGSSVKARILEQEKGEKLIIFKKKRRKGYQKKTGHRQLLSKIQIEEIK
jgi:large subunit ribosomal protein L21